MSPVAIFDRIRLADFSSGQADVLLATLIRMTPMPVAAMRLWPTVDEWMVTARKQFTEDVAGRIEKALRSTGT